MAVAMASVGCAPGTPDADSWREDAQRALGDAASALQSDRVALETYTSGNLPDKYLQTVAVDAEKAAGAASDKLSSGQPPAEERDRYDVVMTHLGAAADLAAEVRVSIVAGQESTYTQLVGELQRATEALGRLDDELLHPVKSSGADS